MIGMYIKSMTTSYGMESESYIINEYYKSRLMSQGSDEYGLHQNMIEIESTLWGSVVLVRFGMVVQN